MILLNKDTRIVKFEVQLSFTFRPILARTHDRSLELARLGYSLDKGAVFSKFQTLGNTRGGYLRRTTPIAGADAEFR